MTGRRKFLLFSFFVVAVAAFAIPWLFLGQPRITEDQLKEIHHGMTIEDVCAILGPPDKKCGQPFIGLGGSIHGPDWSTLDIRIWHLNKYDSILVGFDREGKNAGSYRTYTIRPSIWQRIKQAFDN